MNKYSFGERQLSGVNAMHFASEKLQIVTLIFLFFFFDFLGDILLEIFLQAELRLQRVCSCTLP